MRKIRVMVVDGEVASRRRIVRAVERDACLEVVGASPLGGALDKLKQSDPDLVVFGIDGRTACGVETLASLHSARPKLPILVAGVDVRRGSPLACDVICHGASGYLTVEPDRIEALDVELSPRIHALLTGRRGDDKPPSRTSGPAPCSARIEAVVIGASTGGPDALAKVFSSLPCGLPVPILVVQHMPATFTKCLAERLDAAGPIPVREACDGDLARPGTAWVAPGGSHLIVRGACEGLRLTLDVGPPENLCRPSADVLFRSAASALGGRVLGVVLTGMDRDGLRGCRDIRAAGGSVVVQDEATSVVWGMPGQVANAGLAQKILPLAEIGPEIARIVRASRSAGAES